jgi:glycosyltransferase involved in cell wall biosynthesis
MTIAIISMIREPWGGSEELWGAVAEEALKKGHKVIHLAYQHDPIHPKMQALKDKGLIIYTRPSYKPLVRNPVMKFVKRVLFFVKKRMDNSLGKIFAQRPDIILYNGTCYSIGDEKKLLRLLSGSKSLFFILGHFNREDGADLPAANIDTVRRAYDRTKKVFFITKRSMENAKRDLVMDIPCAFVVRNPVNMSSTELIPLTNTGMVQFAMVGNLRIIHKGQDIGLEVLSSGVWKERNWHLNIYGSGEDEMRLKELVAFLGLKNKVTFHGRVSNIRELWQHNHVLLMPSHMEGMPLAIVEAMICGRPSVVTDVGGHTEWIGEGVHGFIAEAPTVSSFGNALERAWKERDNWATIGKAAHEKAMSLYDPSAGRTLLNLLTDE